EAEKSVHPPPSQAPSQVRLRGGCHQRPLARRTARRRPRVTMWPVTVLPVGMPPRAGRTAADVPVAWRSRPWAARQTAAGAVVAEAAHRVPMAVRPDAAAHG